MAEHCSALPVTPKIRLRDIAADLGITERRAYDIVTDSHASGIRWASGLTIHPFLPGFPNKSFAHDGGIERGREPILRSCDRSCHLSHEENRTAHHPRSKGLAWVVFWRYPSAGEMLQRGLKC
jgi:hypothetical protein